MIEMTEQRAAGGRPADATALLISVIFMIVAGFMQNLDTTIVNVSLPYMQGSLNAARDQITWVVTSYIISSAIFLPFVAWLSTRFGRKAVFLVCTTGFTLASTLCGTAQTIEQIVVFRFLQGAMGAGLVPSIMAVILTSYEGKMRANMVAAYGALSLLGPVAGPTVGGFVTEYFSWRWAFFINVPIGIIVISIVSVLYHERRNATARVQFDAFGTLTLAIALGAFQLMLDRGPTKDWFGSQEILVEAAAAGVFAYLFAAHMATSRTCVIPTALFRDRLFNLGSFLGTLGIGLSFCTIVLILPYIQQLGDYSVVKAGVLFAPRGVGAIAASVLGVRLMAHFDLRAILFGGWVMTAWSLWHLASWTPDVDTMTIVVTNFINGLGLGFIVVGCNFIAFATLPRELNNDASAIYTLIRNAGAAAFIAVSTMVLTQHFQIVHEALSSHVSPFNRALGYDAGSLFWNPRIPRTLQQLDHVVNRNAQIISYSNSYLLLFWVSFLVPLGLLFLGKVPMTPKDAPVVIEE